MWKKTGVVNLFGQNVETFVWSEHTTNYGLVKVYPSRIAVFQGTSKLQNDFFLFY